MIEYHYETEFRLRKEAFYTAWINRVMNTLGAEIQEITYIFSGDDRVHQLNWEFLSHDDYTDILTFDRSAGRRLSGDIFISVDRVAENAKNLGIPFEDEIQRVMIHGILHMSGYPDTSPEEKAVMRQLETEKMKLFHVEQM